jgi:hypothetical protein
MLGQQRVNLQNSKRSIELVAKAGEKLEFWGSLKSILNPAFPAIFGPISNDKI